MMSMDLIGDETELNKKGLGKQLAVWQMKKLNKWLFNWLF